MPTLLFLNQIFREILVLVGRIQILYIDELWFCLNSKDILPVIFQNKVITIVLSFSLNVSTFIL